jgi:hypothetical protein
LLPLSRNLRHRNEEIKASKADVAWARRGGGGGDAFRRREHDDDHHDDHPRYDEQSRS